MHNYAGNILVIIVGICSSNSNLDQFIDAGRLYSIDRFCNIGVFGYDSGRGG